jgi:hypothetical protein
MPVYRSALRSALTRRELFLRWVTPEQFDVGYILAVLLHIVMYEDVQTIACENFLVGRKNKILLRNTLGS